MTTEVFPYYFHPYQGAPWFYPMSGYWPPDHDGYYWHRYDRGPWGPWHPPVELKDHGGKPFVVNIARAARQNRYYRTALWTGKHLQVVLMSIAVGSDIGLEVHPRVDQFIRIEQGRGLVRMGERKDRLHVERSVSDGDAIMIPAGTWHNVINTGHVPLKLYTIYAPPEHPFGTMQRTKAEAMAEHRPLAAEKG